MRQLVRLSKAYKQLGISRRVAYSWANTGKMPAFHINGVWLVDIEEFNTWISSRHNSPPPPPETPPRKAPLQPSRRLKSERMNLSAYGPNCSAVELFERELGRLQATRGKQRPGPFGRVRDANGEVVVDRGLAETIAKLRAEGRSLRKIARQFSVSHVTIIEFLRRRNEPTPQQ
jgi:hypothetical protein